MKNFVQINYNNIEENEEYNKIINTVVKKCFEEEGLDNIKIYINIILTNPEEIKRINKEYRNIDKETDVLSFPMFQKEEIEGLIKKKENIVTDILGDVVISIPRVYEQAEEYNHSFERELSYMVVHGFYHLMGYDHMEEEEKKIMRQKEENVLQKLNITR
ncbi:MAG: rRNA maturation RNase YbeY [Clostridia bacterium]|jgi:probable rRNA maturation factor|nr:metalloprotein YbeY family [Clostridium sp. CAG:571]HJJ06288.1 rRNA maturation RNase YbeY [Clostridiaceae bacterium]HJJ14265.1 rRNA maturation RNase YbeY [Clostridiaceae bacterium]